MPKPRVRRPDGTTVQTTTTTTPDAPVVPTTPDASIVTTPDAPVIVPSVPAVPVARALTVADVIPGIPDGYAVPAFVNAFRDAFRAVSALPAVTRDQRIVVRDAFVAAMVAAMPGHDVPVGRHTGRWSGCPVFESQNVMYLAACMANVALTNGHIMAAWRAELPNAKCDYLARDYAWTTLSEYINHRHNGAIVPGAYDAINAWYGRNRKPIE